MRKTYVYIIELKKSVKIGCSVNPWERLNNVKVGISEEIQHFHIYEVDNHEFVERQLHDKFHVERLEGEWFEKTRHIIPMTTEFINTIHHGIKVE